MSILNALDNPYELMCAGLAVTAVIMLVLWFIMLATQNAGIVDVGWAASMGLLAVMYATLSDGLPLRRAAIGTIAGAWAGRLAIYLLVDRVLGRPEDGRYETLRARWGARANAYFFPFFQVQAVLAVVLSVPFLLVSQNAALQLAIVEIAAIALFVVGIVGESVADRQLARFRAAAAGTRQTCRMGLWRYSRHPNYFFEWLIWCSYALMALAAPYGWLGLVSPAIMLFLLFRVTGIPATEAQAIRTRGDDYRRYQRTTSVFVPWFPQKEYG
jgi:steroid 5-alpha reductase family enzyme